MKNIDNWLIANKLALNVNKTTYMLFRPKCSKIPDPSLKLSIRNNKIERVSSTKLLGVLVDDHLSWKLHMKQLISKLRSTIGVVKRIRSYLNQHSLLTIYHSLFMSQIKYCIANWCFGCKTELNKIENLNTNFIRIALNASKSIDGEQLLKTCNFLSIKNTWKFEIALTMFKYHTGKLSMAFNNIFLNKCTSIKTRSNSNLVPTTSRVTVSQQALRFVGPKIWNAIPKSIKESSTVNSFKNQMRKHRLNK